MYFLDRKTPVVIFALLYFCVCEVRPTLAQTNQDVCPEGGMQLAAAEEVQSFNLEHYELNMTCFWNITAPEGMFVFINIVEYHLEDAYGADWNDTIKDYERYVCMYDSITMTGGDDVSKPEKIC